MSLSNSVALSALVGEIPYVPAVGDEVLALLKTLLVEHRPARVLEIGTAVGYSALQMLETFPEMEELVTIERNEAMADQAAANFEQYDPCGVIRLIRGDAVEVLPQLDGAFGLIFVDANKTAYSEYYRWAKRLLVPGGVMVADNVLCRGLVRGPEFVPRKHRSAVLKLRAFIQMAEGDSEMETSVIDMGDGVLVARKVGCTGR